MRPQPPIALDDVQAGSAWFQQVLGLTSGNGGPNWVRGPEGYVVVVAGPGPQAD